jgi:uncharacterized protein (TIGR03083 family)
VDALEDTWASVDRLGRSLREDEWGLPTACPGWSVKDQVAHLAGLEASLLGRVDPPHELPTDPPHVRNDLGRLMELQVDLRRARAPSVLLAELREVAAERLDQLRRLVAGGGDPDVPAPGGGRGPLSRVLATRVVDVYTHEQDVRRAVGRPGHTTGPVAEHVRDQLLSALGWVLARKVGAGEGTTVHLALTGPLATTVEVAVEDGRGRVAAPGVGAPTAGARLTFGAFLALGTGRVHSAAALATGEVELWGEVALGRRFLDQLAITP